MADRLGFRLKAGVVIPSTNTTVQPEFDSMRPRGVTNHIGRILLADMPLTDDTEFEQMVAAIDADLLGAVDRVMTCRPDCMIMGMSIPTFWGGTAGALMLQKRLEDRARVPVTLGSHACAAALQAYPSVKTIGVLTPYQPVGDAQVARYFQEAGWQVKLTHSLKRPSEVQIAHATEADLRLGLRHLAEAGVDAIVQTGTDLAIADIAGEAERWLGIPVIAINVATYWAALRMAGIQDIIEGYGSLLLEH